MNKSKNKHKFLNIIVLILLVTLIVASSIYIIRNLLNEKKQKNVLKKLKNIIEVPDNEIILEDDNENTNTIEDNKSIRKNNQTDIEVNLLELYKRNRDLVGWIRVNNTNINYPVMQRDYYYLRRNFNRNTSSYGTPFLAPYCVIRQTDNLIIYGHHIKSGKMFADLDRYKSKSYYDNHKFIELYSLESNSTIRHTYEICYVLKKNADNNGFKFYNYFNMSNEEFKEYKIQCNKLALYNTNNEINYGDQLITLVTCEYSQKNGRIVVIGRKI